MDYVRRINLKTDCGDHRSELINFCLMKEEQYVAIGWSCVYSTETVFDDYKSFYYAVERKKREDGSRMNHALNSFWYVVENDLFWTRDLHGFYWICRAKGVAVPYCNKDLDIGAVVPVEAYKYGLEVPGKIKASFNRANGGIIDDIRDEKNLIVNYSMHVFNKLSKREVYPEIHKEEGCIIDNLPDFDLEELVITYLQIKENYYVLSNSIANKSTTVRIECELMSRDINRPQKAVVQVKAKEMINPEEYREYLQNGYKVFFYNGGRVAESNEFCYISKQTLLDFYTEYASILPDSITQWETLFD